MNDEADAQQNDVYAVFCGMIDQTGAQRLATAIGTASIHKTTTFHLLFQSTGGTPGDGVFIYNLFRSVPFKVVLYNSGTVSSAAVLAYLGASERVASAAATFMLHRTFNSPMMATSEKLKSITDSVVLDDERGEAILRAHVSLTEPQWAIHRVADLFLSAKEALGSGLVTSIRDFAVPPGANLFSLF